MEPERQTLQYNTPENIIPKTSFNVGRVASTLLITVFVLSIIAVLAWFIYLSPERTSGEDLSTIPATTQEVTVPDIKSDKDLEKLENEVKNLNIDSLSKDLDANDTESKDF